VSVLWSEGYGAGLIEIVLAYGHPHDVSKPLIQVQTCFSEQDCCSPSLGEAIARAEHRDACFARSEWVDAGDSFDPFPPVPVPDQSLDHSERTVAVDGEERAATVVSYGNYAALRFHQGSTVVTAVARLGFLSPLSFRVIDDLEPYFAGYRRFVLGFLRPLSLDTQGIRFLKANGRFAARVPGLASGLALAVRPAGSVEAPRARVGPEDAFCGAARKDLRVPLRVEGPTRTMRGVPAQWL
jgi:hypothetical protein